MKKISVPSDKKILIITVTIALLIIVGIVAGVFYAVNNINKTTTTNKTTVKKDRSSIAETLVERAEEAKSRDDTRRAIRFYEQARKQYLIDNNEQGAASVDTSLCSLGETDYCNTDN